MSEGAIVSDFKIRPLHRRRHGRRKRVAVLNQRELAELLNVSLDDLRARLDELVGAITKTAPVRCGQPRPNRIWSIFSINLGN